LAESNNGNGNSNSNGPKTKISIPFYLNWRFWLILIVSQVVLITAAFLIFTPTQIGQSLFKFASDPALYVILGTVAAGIAGIWSKVDDALKKTDRKADRAASTAVELSDRVDINAERQTWMETSMEAYGRMAHNLTDDLQQERTETKLVVAELKNQILALIDQNKSQQAELDRLKETHQREIAELKEQIRLMIVEKSGDKDKIVSLETQVSLLKDRVRELEEREGKLNSENNKLKEQLRGRRITDQLPALSDGDTVRLSLVSEEDKDSQP
jgi:regulator of replication initiation timing